MLEGSEGDGQPPGTNGQEEPGTTGRGGTRGSLSITDPFWLKVGALVPLSEKGHHQGVTASSTHQFPP